jgi:two-component system sensor histidine kinase KdpD
MPPIGEFWVADPEHWVALATFLITSVVASQLSARATRQCNEMEKLYALSRALILLDPKESIPRQLTRHIRTVFGIEGVAVFHEETGELCADGPSETHFPESLMRECALKSSADGIASRNVSVRPLSLAGPSFGSIAFASRLISETAQNAVAGLAAMALERARVQELAGRVEAARQSERLESTLLDAVAHEFETPLTSIKAAVSGGGRLACRPVMRPAAREKQRFR